MKKKKNIKLNYTYNLLFQIFNIIVPLITAPYLSRVLGADGIGRVSFIESHVTFFGLFAALGITLYGQREVSYAQDDPHKRSVVFWNTKLCEIAVSAVVMMCYICFSCFMENRIIYFIYTLYLVNIMADVSWFFQGLEEFGTIILRNVILKSANVIYIFVFIKDRDDLIKYVAAHMIFTVLASASLWMKLPAYLVKISLKEISPFKDWKVIVGMFLPVIAIQIYTVLDKAMIGHITKNEFENGYYEQAVKISKTTLTIVTALSTVLVPRIGNLFEKKEEAKIKELMYKGYRFIWFLSLPLCAGLIAISDNFVPWYFGEDFGKVAFLLKVLAFLIPVIGLSNITGIQYLIPTKRENMLTLSVSLGAVSNFILNLILIRYLASMGASIASVLAEIVVTVAQLIIVRKELNIFKILASGAPYLSATIFMGGILFVAEHFIRPAPSVVNTMLIVVAGFVIYILFLFMLRDPLIKELKDTVLNFIKKKNA